MEDSKKADLIQMGRMLSVKEVLQMWPISREFLSRRTHCPDENLRIPCVMIGRKPLYPFDELMWYREKHRFQPKQKQRRAKQ